MIVVYEHFRIYIDVKMLFKINNFIDLIRSVVKKIYFEIINYFN